MPYTMSIGEQIKRARQEAGLSQAALARRSGTSQAAISRIERGLEEPTLRRVEQIAASLGLRPRIEFEPLAEPDAEPRRLAEQARKTAQDRFEEGLSWNLFLHGIVDAERVRG
jgi:transcriptional regulator with XRE-family HTH domain